MSGLYKQLSQTQTDPGLAGGDSGIKKRYDRTALSTPFRVYCPIVCGIAQQGRIIPNLVDMKFIYTKSDSLFHYTCPSTTTGTFRLEIVSASLHIKRVKLYPSVEAQIVSKLTSGSPASFFFRNEYARSFTLRAGESQIRLPNILTTGNELGFGD